MTVTGGIRVASARAAQRGMTLIEIMVVILIMGLIMGTVGYAVFRYLRRSEVKTTRMKVERVLDAVQEYQAANRKGDGDCPVDLSVLVPERVKSDMIKDAWNQPLKIACQGEKVCVYSIGKNKRDENGGGDDIRACTQGAGEG
jgi:prepilin-type N-terminal cleavage/methylation domain-containing protein